MYEGLGTRLSYTGRRPPSATSPGGAFAGIQPSLQIPSELGRSYLQSHLGTHVAKCDQFGQGAGEFIGRTGNSICACPVAACLDYVSVRGVSPGPLFRKRDGKPLLKFSFVVEVRKVLAAAGLPAGGHSFRIGRRRRVWRTRSSRPWADGAAPRFVATSGHRGSSWPQRRSRLPASPSLRRRLTTYHAYSCVMPRRLPYFRCLCINMLYIMRGI